MYKQLRFDHKILPMNWCDTKDWVSAISYFNLPGSVCVNVLIHS